ncbi:LptA/OstA family protein [Beijerinckia indica]|uniref:OstA family protein n=1 Tax=Beijerinckia indica subsp. indica (strain ATCC 9039 / DSM 1715 / NCIMB 8712) TaxID=395963 RepID=B2IFL1_BEII9|nr:LptA/OstA family protein [Beijerinckia indica]ACB94222.1 OstA family protein [Beijerinckia indica subsp. indica ATCC 9039]
MSPIALLRHAWWRPALIGLFFLQMGLSPTSLAAKPPVAAKPAAPAPADPSAGRVLPGGNGHQPVNIEATKLDYFDKEQKLIYTGNVVATQGETILKTSTLIIYLVPKGSTANSAGGTGSDQVRRMEAPNAVVMISKDQVGTGDSGVYEKAENKVTLNGNVTLTQGPNVTKGDKLVYDLHTSQAVVIGHVRSLFLPSDSKSAEAPAKPAAPKP